MQIQAVLTTHAGFIGEHDDRISSLGLRTQSGQVFVNLALDQNSILLIGAVQRPLRRKAELCHDFSDCGQAQRDPEAPFDQFPNESKRPKPETEAQLVGCVVADGTCDPLQLIWSDFWRPSAAKFRIQSVLAFIGYGRQPSEDCASGDFEELRHVADRTARPDHFHGLHSNPLLLMASTGKDRFV